MKTLEEKRAKQNEHSRRNRAKFPERTRESSAASHIKRFYKMSREEYAALLESQNGVCAICGGNDRRLTVDHDHECCPGPHSCGKCIRGILCNTCNSGLGAFRDEESRLLGAIAYLRSFT